MNCGFRLANKTQSQTWLPNLKCHERIVALSQNAKKEPVPLSQPTQQILGICDLVIDIVEKFAPPRQARDKAISRFDRPASSPQIACCNPKVFFASSKIFKTGLTRLWRSTPSSNRLIATLTIGMIHANSSVKLSAQFRLGWLLFQNCVEACSSVPVRSHFQLKTPDNLQINLSSTGEIFIG